jgi:hypothetical protein
LFELLESIELLDVPQQAALVFSRGSLCGLMAAGSTCSACIDQGLSEAYPAAAWVGPHVTNVKINHQK